jgi:hypothetical protein
MCAGNSRSTMGPTGLPPLRFSICAGSSGRPGCSNIARFISLKDNPRSGGVALVTSPGGDVERRSPDASLDSASVLEVAAGDVVRSGCRAAPGLVRVAPEFVLLEATRGAERTVGVDTGRPAIAALRVGFTAGCGITCALANCSRGIETTE